MQFSKTSHNPQTFITRLLQQKHSQINREHIKEIPFIALPSSCSFYDRIYTQIHSNLNALKILFIAPTICQSKLHSIIDHQNEEHTTLHTYTYIDMDIKSFIGKYAGWSLWKESIFKSKCSIKKLWSAVCISMFGCGIPTLQHWFLTPALTTKHFYAHNQILRRKSLASATPMRLSEHAGNFTT